TRLITPSPDRVKPLCPIADKCGGCSLQHLAYPAQLKFKQVLVRENLRRIGGFEDIDVLPVIGMDEPYYYRSKGQYPVSFDKKLKSRISGFTRAQATELSTAGAVLSPTSATRG
ncbi:MAG: hypothetical protein IJR45_05665, partial [Firmicutes bacterium]|nr:hypothetical protein [Bacillota bacterium]